MNDVNRQRLGLAFWATVLAVGAIALFRGSDATVSPKSGQVADVSPAALIVNSLWSPTTAFQLIDPTGVVRVGDVVFAGAPADVREVGYVASVRKDKRSPHVLTIAMFDAEVWSDSATFTVHRNSGRLGDVLATLIPPAKRDQLQAKLTLAFDSHVDEVAREILPLVMQSMRASLPVIESAMQDAVQRREKKIRSLAARYREEIVAESLLPLVREEILPIVKRHAQEPAESIGREIWDRASLFRFGWRAIYDKSPLPERELLAGEWRRFVDEEVGPIVEEHLDEIAAAVEAILREVAANERVRQQFSDVVATIAKDPEARDLFRDVLRESIVENEGLRQIWIDIWNSPEAKKRLHRVGQRIEPVLRELGDELMGTRVAGIEPGFAKVLRNQILAKDRTWITITPADVSHPDSSQQDTSDRDTSERDTSPKTPSLTLAISTEFTPYPVLYIAQD